ncbi:MAG: hypothetical protein D6E12_10485 [Desulfovibrio sp.]|nr:MAG: hypothetical protein D6E12_10485 [Desulfovibrio sp.]
MDTTPPSELTAQHIVEELLRIFDECFLGADKAGAFLEPGPNGLLGLLEQLSAEQASQPAAGASVAAHARHVAFSLNAFHEWIQGKRDITYDWKRSWQQHIVDDDQWRQLQKEIRGHHDALKTAITTNAPVDAKSAWGAVGVLTHTAYHLGAIQVKFDELRAFQGPATP